MEGSKTLLFSFDYLLPGGKHIKTDRDCMYQVSGPRITELTQGTPKFVSPFLLHTKRCFFFFFFFFFFFILFLGKKSANSSDNRRIYQPGKLCTLPVASVCEHHENLMASDRASSLLVRPTWDPQFPSAGRTASTTANFLRFKWTAMSDFLNLYCNGIYSTRQKRVIWHHH